MLQVLQSKPILSISLIVFFMLAFSMESIPISIMEARNFVTAREMITDGNWLLPTMNGEARYEKPPLPTWITALFGMLFGLEILGALRFPTIIFIALIGIATYMLSKKIVNDQKHGFINGLIVITSFYVIGITLEAPWDIYTHGFMMIGIYHLFQFFEKESKYILNVFLAAIFMGCSILCKGPISMYALLLPFLLAYGMTFKFKTLQPKILPLVGCLILALIVGGWWYVYVRMVDPLTFEAIAIRETNNWHSYNIKPFYYYWSFFTQSGIWTIPALISLMYPYLKNRVKNLKAYQFSLLWTLFALILLSLVPEKKSRYLMPVLIPLAINTGFYIEYLFRRFKNFTAVKETFPVYFNFGLIALIAIALPFGIAFLFPELINFEMTDGSISHWVLFGFLTISSIGIGMFMFINLKNKRIETVFCLTVAFQIAVFLIALPTLKSVVGTQNNPITNLEEDHLKIYGFSNVSPEIIWQYGKKIPSIKLGKGAIELPKERIFGILGYNISEDDMEELKSKYDIKKIDRFDLNTVPVNSSRHNDRLINDFYILMLR